MRKPSILATITIVTRPIGAIRRTMAQLRGGQPKVSNRAA